MKGSAAPKPEDAMSPMPSVAPESATFKAASGEGRFLSPGLRSRNSEQKDTLDLSMTKSKFSVDPKGILEKSELGK